MNNRVTHDLNAWQILTTDGNTFLAIQTRGNLNGKTGIVAIQVNSATSFGPGRKSE